METAPPTEKTPEKGRRWWRSRPFLFISLAIHLIFALGAGYLVVSRYSAGRKLTFAAGPKSPNPSERALQHRVQMQQKSQSAPAAVPKRVLTTGAAKVELPPIPVVPGAKEGPPVPKMGAAGGAAFGAPGGTGGGVGGTGTGVSINFFGIRDKSSSVVIMIDVSDSMFLRTGDAEFGKGLLKHGKEQSFQTVRDEAVKLVQSLNPNVSFGIIRWSGGAYSWKPELVAATPENVQAAIDHIQNEVDMKSARPRGRPGGTRHDYALEEAFKLKPEVIYMITDGNATASQPGGKGLEPIPPEELFKITEDGQKALTKRARLHVIYYLNGKEKADERQMLMNLSARNSGQFRTVIAPGRQN